MASLETIAVACSKCGVPIAWVKTEAGRPMPLDPKPDPAGIAFVRYDNGRLVVKVRSKSDPRPRGIAYMPHFATCEAINRGRQPKKEKSCKPPTPEPAATLFDSL